MTKQQTSKETTQRKRQAASAPKSSTTAAMSPDQQQPAGEERIAHLTGRVLRDTDGERFKAFVELITDLDAGRADVREVLDVCGVVALVLDARRSEPAARRLPAVDYEPIISACEPEIAAQTSVANLAPQYQTAEHQARLVAEHMQGLRERFAEWQALADFYADTLERVMRRRRITRSLMNSSS